MHNCTPQTKQHINNRTINKDGIYKYLYTGKILEENKRINLTADECYKIHKDKEVKLDLYGKSVKIGIQSRKQTVTRDLYGLREPDGSCTGSVVKIDKQVYKNIVLTAKIFIEVERMKGHFIPELNQIVVKNEVKFQVNANSSYTDAFLGTYWFNKMEIPKSRCDLYRNLLIADAKIHQPIIPELQTFVSLTVNQTQIAVLTLNQKISICGREGYTTSEKNLFIILHREKDEILGEVKNLKPSEIDPDLDQEQRLKTLILDLSLKIQTDFKTTIMMICQSRRESLQNDLSLLDKLQGSYGLHAGQKRYIGTEVISYGAATYLIPGNEVNATLRPYKNNECCKEIPIRIRSNDSLNSIDAFADPRTLVIRSLCTPRICDAAFPYFYSIKFNEDNEQTWLCTKGTPEIHPCQIKPRKVELMMNPKLRIDNLLSHPNLNPSIYTKNQLKSHKLSNLVMEARDVIELKTAIGVARQGRIEDVRILTSNPGEEELTSIKSKILGPLDALFHGQWTGFVSGIVSLLILVLLIIIIYKIVVLILKKLSHSDLRTRFAGLHLGSRRAYKNLRKEGDDRYKMLNNRLDEGKSKLLDCEFDVEKQKERIHRLERGMVVLTRLDKLIPESANKDIITTAIVEQGNQYPPEGK